MGKPKEEEEALAAINIGTTTGNWHHVIKAIFDHFVFCFSCCVVWRQEMVQAA